MKRSNRSTPKRPPLHHTLRAIALCVWLAWVGVGAPTTTLARSTVVHQHATVPLLSSTGTLALYQQQQSTATQAPSDPGAEPDIDADDEAETFGTEQGQASTIYLPLLLSTQTDGLSSSLERMNTSRIGSAAPITFEKRVISSSDDGEERSGGSMSLSSSDLELVVDTGINQVVGMRFTAITIPKGATISNAYVQFGVDEVSTDVANLTIRGEATDNAPGLTTANFNLSQRSRTTAAISWIPPQWPTVGERGANQRTPNLAAILQEIINRSGWNSGNALVLLVTGSGRRTAYAYDISPSGAPLLHVEYTTAPVNQAPVVNAGADQSITLPATAALNGSVTDDGLPANNLTVTWSKVSGPGAVTFSSTNAATTSATFGAAGSYVLRLTATDGELSNSDEVAVSVVVPTGPVTLQKRIAASQDDGEEQSGGRVLLSTSALQLVMAGTVSQTVGLRFSGLNIPKGATISQAYLQFSTYRALDRTVALTIRGEATDNAALFTTTNFNLSRRSRTAATVGWAPPAWPTVGESGVNQRTPNLAAIVQEIINRPGWSSGNALAFLFTGSGRRTAYAYEAAPTQAPLLHVEYVVAPTNQAPMVNAGADQTVTLPAAAALNGSVTDDGLPANSLTATWSKVSGPGAVTFGAANAASTTATFATAGVYVLRLTATDGQLTSNDQVQITVNATTGVTFVGAGDIAVCGSPNDEATALLLDQIPGTVFTLGDNVYNDGSASEFAQCYDPSWGRHKARTRPATGNHDYHIPGAADYFAYFGAAAGDPSKGYYSYDLGEWHIIVLNSECSEVGGCKTTSPQGQWLQADLAANPRTCTLAIWHKPRFSSGSHGNNTTMSEFWQLLYNAGADVILNGHDHHYERFGPQTASGVADATYGIRQFLVGTGGAGLYPYGTIQPNSETRNNTTFGVLKMTLRATSYDWEFIPIAGQSYRDSGSAACNTGTPSISATE